MAVDKTRHDDAPGRVDLDGAARLGKIFDAAAGTDLLYHAIAHEERTVVYYAEIVELAIAPRALRSMQSQ